MADLFGRIWKGLVAARKRYITGEQMNRNNTYTSELNSIYETGGLKLSDT